MIRTHAVLPFNRTGTIFHVYLIYIALTGMLLASCGVCLKLLLKTGQATNARVNLLSQLEDVQRQLRSDFREAALVDVAEDQLTLKLAESQIAWSIESCQLIRRLKDTPEEALAVYRFSPESHLAFLRDADFVQLRLTEAAPGEMKDLPRLDNVVRSSIGLSFQVKEVR